jgi:hypothetical protein
MTVGALLVPFIENSSPRLLSASKKSNFGSGFWLWWMSTANGVSGVCLGGQEGGSVACCSGMRIDVEEEEQEKVPF